MNVTMSPGTSSLASKWRGLPSLCDAHEYVHRYALDCLDTPNEVAVVRDEFVQCFEALFGSLLLHEANWEK